MHFTLSQVSSVQYYIYEAWWYVKNIYTFIQKGSEQLPEDFH